jgi:hypothetical protein
MRKTWTTEEDEVIRSDYPKGGADAVLLKLKDRTYNAIYKRARILEVRADIVLRTGTLFGRPGFFAYRK